MLEEITQRISVVIAIFVGVGLAWFVRKWRMARDSYVYKRYSSGCTIVKVPGWLFIGNLPDFFGRNLMTTLMEWPKRYGAWAMCFLPRAKGRVFVISDADTARDILSRRPKLFNRSPFGEYVKRWSGLQHGLFFVNGNEWARLRKFCAPSFNKLNIQNSIPTIWSSVEALSNQWVNCITAKKEANSILEVDFVQSMILHALNVLTNVSFYCEDKNNLHLQYFKSSIFAQDVLNQLYLTGHPFPKIFYDFLYLWDRKKWNNLNESLQRMDMHSRELFRWRIKERETENAAKAVPKASLLEAMLSKEAQQFVDENFATASSNWENDVVGSIKMFYNAGGETTGITIANICMFLTQDKDLFFKVREEIDQFLEKDISLVTQTNDSTMNTVGSIMGKLPLLNSVVKETLRLVSPVPVLMQYCLNQNNPKDTSAIVLENELEIFPEDVCYLNLYAISRDEKVFGKDAESFNAYRWINKSKGELDMMEKNWFPFGYGARICPGMYLSLMEIMLTMVVIVHKFEIQLTCDVSALDYYFQILRRPSKMPFQLSLRKDKR